ncbi:hypothetical protein [Microbacterium sp.]|uniref:hypothetical protein n=1 Tax=Microbacterium sp. TaxID=51671 RepID=UPI0025D1D786|nr:hypothetical protein [Microbacterium sp.]MBT9605761.1 hypothetical protein [Microbacterium sp.]
MSSHARGKRRYRKTQGRRVWVFSELNHDLRPEHVAKIITAAGLEQARLEAAAQQEATARTNEEDGHA